MRAHSNKLNISLINAGQMKRLANSSENFVLLIINPKNDVDNEDFKGCDFGRNLCLFFEVKQKEYLVLFVLEKSFFCVFMFCFKRYKFYDLLFLF